MSAPPSAAATAFAAAFVLATVVLVAVSGDIQARLMDVYQPMKMAAAEALYNTTERRQLLAAHHRQPERQAGVPDPGPHLLSLIAELTWNGQVRA